MPGNTFDVDPGEHGLNIYDEHLIDSPYANSEEDLVRKIDDLRNREYWSYDEWQTYKSLVGEAMYNRAVNISEEDGMKLLDFEPPGGITTNSNSVLGQWEPETVLSGGYNDDDVRSWYEDHDDELTPEEDAKFKARLGITDPEPTPEPTTKKTGAESFLPDPIDPTGLTFVEEKDPNAPSAGLPGLGMPTIRRVRGSDGKLYMEKRENGIVNYYPLPETTTTESTGPSFSQAPSPEEKRNEEIDRLEALGTSGYERGHEEGVDRAAQDMLSANNRRDNAIRYRDQVSLNGVTLGDKKIVIDRPNADSTLKEQSDGDFHINFDDLTNSARISIDLESMVSDFIDLSNPDVKLETYLETIPEDLMAVDYEALDVYYVKQELDKIADETKNLEEMTTAIGDQIANFINCLRYTSDEVEELFADYFKKFIFNSAASILRDEANEYNIHVNAFDKIVLRYLDRDLLRFVPDSELPIMRELLTQVDQWKYNHMSAWDKFCTDAQTLVFSVAYGVDKRLEQMEDGALNYLLLGWKELAVLIGDKDMIAEADQMLLSSMDMAGDSRADAWYDQVVDRGALNRYSGYGKYHDSGEVLGTTFTDIAVKSLATMTGMGTFGTVLLTSLGRHGANVQKIAASRENGELTADEITDASLAYAYLDLATAYIEKSASKIKIRGENGEFLGGAFAGKTVTAAGSTAMKTVFSKYPQFLLDDTVSNKDLATYWGYRNRGEDVPKEVMVKVMETVVNSFMGAGAEDGKLDKFSSGYDKYTGWWNDNGRDAAIAITGDKDVYEIDSVGGYAGELAGGIYDMFAGGSPSDGSGTTGSLNPYVRLYDQMAQMFSGVIPG